MSQISYKQCDCCDKPLGSKWRSLRAKGWRYIWFAKDDELDICDNCWSKIKQYVREQNEKEVDNGAIS